MTNRTEIFQLTYVSSLTLALDDNELLALAEEAQVWNQEHDITSLLLISDLYVIQRIEGPEAEVEALFAKLELDFRHADVIRLEEKRNETRDFPSSAFDFQIFTAWMIEHKLPNLIAYLEDPLVSDAHREKLQKEVDHFFKIQKELSINPDLAI